MLWRRWPVGVRGHSLFLWPLPPRLSFILILPPKREKGNVTRRRRCLRQREREEERRRRVVFLSPSSHPTPRTFRPAVSSGWERGPKRRGLFLSSFTSFFSAADLACPPPPLFPSVKKIRDTQSEERERKGETHL